MRRVLNRLFKTDTYREISVNTDLQVNDIILKPVQWSVVEYKGVEIFSY